MCIGLHTLPPCLLFCGNYILHESEYDVHIFCVALDIIIYPAALNLLGAAPKARTLWALAKSFARCKTNIASNAKHPFTKLYSFFIFLYLFFCSCNVLTVLRRNFVGANLEPAAAALVVTPGIISRSPHKRRSIA